MLVCLALIHIAFYINTYSVFGIYIILFGVACNYFSCMDNTFHFSSLQLEVLF